MKRKVFIAIPSTGTVVDVLHPTLRKMEELYKDRIEFIYPEVTVRRIFHDYARNCLVDEFLESDAEVMWFIDSDVVPPLHALDLVTMHWDTWELAGCPYPVFMTPPKEEVPQVLFTVYNGTADRSLYVSAVIPKDGLEFVSGLATGCLFIKREIFSLIERPWFSFEYDPTSRVMTLGEDLGFCLKMAKLGKQFLVDYSMLCNHYKMLGLLDVNNYAIEYTNKSLKNFETQIRTQLKERVLTKKKEQKTIIPHSGLVLPERFNVK